MVEIGEVSQLGMPPVPIVLRSKEVVPNIAKAKEAAFLVLYWSFLKALNAKCTLSSLETEFMM